MNSTGTGALVRIKFFDNKAANPTELYAAAPTGGLFRTRNVLDSLPIWENLTDSTRLPVQGVRDFAFGPTPNIIYIGTGIRYPLDYDRTYGIGVLKTTDGGLTWQETGLRFRPPGEFKEVAHDILVHPTNGDTIHVLCGRSYFRSDDAAVHFTLKKTNAHPSPAGREDAFRSVTFKPGSPHVLYLTTDAGYFYRSTNSGDSWEEFAIDSLLGIVGQVARMDITVSERNPDLIYMGAFAQKNEYLLRSLDGGSTWQFLLKKNLGTSYERHPLAISPNNDNVLYTGGLFLHEVKIGTDGKVATKQITDGNVHLDHREICVVSDGKGGDIIYSANDGGPYRAVFDGKNWVWESLSGTGMNNMQLYGIGVAEDYSVVAGGTQDLGTMLIYPAGTAIKPNLSGDGSDCAVDPFNPSNVFSITWALTPPVIYKSTDGGLKWARWNKGMVNNGDKYFHPMVLHQNGNLYSATTKVHYLPYGTESWRQIGDINLPTDEPWRVTHLAVTSDDDIIYAYGDQLYRSDNATADTAATWVQLKENLGWVANYKQGGNSLQAVEADPEDPMRVWVGFRSYDKPFKVYFSNDGGETWASVSTGLPQYPVTALVAQAGTDDVLYAGTDVGVYVNFNASNPDSEWQPFNSGLPVCIIADLEANYCVGKLVAATHARGIWDTPFAVPSEFKRIEIKKDTEWNFKVLRNDVVVRSGATLILKGEVRIAGGKKITVEKGAKLVLDGAHLSDLCGQPWAGIQTEAGSRGFLGLFFGKTAGEIELLNGATLEKIMD